MFELLPPSLSLSHRRGGTPGMDDKDCTVLYKILTAAEKDAMPEKSWQGTALDVSRAHSCSLSLSESRIL